jgi:hypothetical protein
MLRKTASQTESSEGGNRPEDSLLSYARPHDPEAEKRQIMVEVKGLEKKRGV